MDLVGIAIFDRLEQALQPRPELNEHMWSRREIENYLASQEALLAYASTSGMEAALGPLFAPVERDRYTKVMRECIEDLVPRAALRDSEDRWWSEVKASTEFLDRLFESFFSKLALPNLMSKSSYHVLARHVPRANVHPDVVAMLDRIARVASQARRA